MSEQTHYPHEARVQRFAYMAFAAATAFAAVLALTSGDTLLGFEVPLVARLALAVAGLAGGVIGAARRSTPIALAGALLLVLGVTPGGTLSPSLVDYVLAVAFGGALLVGVELVHMTVRYERAHRAVERDEVPAEHVNRVTDEALKTLGARAAAAVGVVAVSVGVAHLLAAIGPAVWRAGVETTAPIGVALAGLALLGAASLYILTRGATLRRVESTAMESASDAVE